MKEIAQSVVVATTLLCFVVCIGALGCIVWLPGSANEIGAQATAGGAVAPANGTQPMGTPPAGPAPVGYPPQGGGPNGTAPGGSMPGGSTGSTASNLSGAHTVDGQTVTETGKTYTSSAGDISAVYVKNGGTLTLVNPTISTTGATSSNDASSFYGLNAAVLAAENSTVSITGGTISTTGSGANGAFPYGTGSAISLTGVTITATGGGGHGVMASGGGTLRLNDTDITTTGANSAPIATDRGGGTVAVTGGTVVASGIDSPGIYSTGVIAVEGATITATGSEAAVIEGRNSIALTTTDLIGSKGTRDRGVMVYQSMSGDADVGLGSFTMTGGSYDWTSTTGPAFYVTNTNATIALSGVAITNSAAELLNASAGSWGTAGSNGGTVIFTADNEALDGSITADEISAIAAVLRNGTTLSGAITSAALTLDTTCTWNVTGDSALTTLSDTAGISGSTVTNIVGNGHTVTYDSALAGNSALGGKTYSLVNGGILAPASAIGAATTTSASATNASGSGGGSEEYTGDVTSTVTVTTTAPGTTAAAGISPEATDAATPEAATPTATHAGTTAAQTAATTATATTRAGPDALPLAAGALGVGAVLLVVRRR